MEKGKKGKQDPKCNNGRTTNSGKCEKLRGASTGERGFLKDTPEGCILKMQSVWDAYLPTQSPMYTYNALKSDKNLAKLINSNH